jgi:N-acetylglucosaminyl-diphospho-decaprenol L-rhamnosyltransferase
LSADALAVVVVSHNSADSLPVLLRELGQQLRPTDELVVVDNASQDGSAEVARAQGPVVKVIESPGNVGFGAGCHLGANATAAPLLFFINPDCRLAAGCVDRLRAAATERPEWGAWQAAVMLPDGRINTDGGVVHYIGIGWAGDCGKTAEAMPAQEREVGFPSGAALVIRRGVWEAVGGLDPSYFMYSEDLDLGLRLWLIGSAVGVVPQAQVIHSYEFDKGPQKWFWLERNRWRTLLSVYPLSLLLVLTPVLLATELVLLLVAAREGWLPSKLRAQLAVLRSLPEIGERRRSVQAMRRATVSQFTSHLSSSLDNEYLSLGTQPWAVALQATYWRGAQRLLRALGR